MLTGGALVTRSFTSTTVKHSQPQTLEVNVLFVHQNLPGQFKHIAPALAAQPGSHVVALSMREMAPTIWKGVRVVSYAARRSSSRAIHAFRTNPV